MSLGTLETETIAVSEDREIANAILASYNIAQDLAASTKDNSKKAIEEALRCGALLNAKKSTVGHGKWLDWMTEFLPGLNSRTLHNWMRLANLNHDSLLKKSNPKSLRQAYIAIGMLPDSAQGVRKRLDSQSKPLKTSNGNTQYLSLFHQLFAEKPIEALLAKKLEEFGDWSKDELENLISVLGPIAELRAKLTYWLDNKLKGTGDDEPGF